MTPGRRRFPKDARLLRPVEFDRVYRCRRSAAEGALVMYACPALVGGSVPSSGRGGPATAADAGASPDAGPPRIGLSVSRRVGNAVVRNRWKRRLREAFRAVRATMPQGQDYIVVVRPAPPPRGDEGATRIEEALVSLARRIVARPGHGKAAPAEGATRPRRR